MRKSQKTLCLILGCLIALGTSKTMTVSAGDEVTLQVSEKTGNKGDTITIPVSLSGDNVGGMDFVVTYDPQELQFVSAKKGEAAKSGNLCDINHMKERSSIHYVYASTKAIDGGGEILSLQFEVLDDAREAHTVGVNVKKILDVDINELPYQVEGGRTISPTVDNSQSDLTSREEGGTGASEDGSDTAAGEADRIERVLNAQEELVKEVQSNNAKRKIVVKTKDGIKDITDTVGQENGASSMSGDTTEETKTNYVMIFGLVALAALGVLVASVYIVRKRNKNEKEV